MNSVTDTLAEKEVTSTFFRIAVSKGLLDDAQAQEVCAEAQRTSREPTAVLLERGLITANLVTNIHKEVERTLGPKTIGGHRILSTLGKGGMGVVYRALQISMNREVALKVMDDVLSRQPLFADRFLREAQASAKVNHPNVVTVYDTGCDGQQFYLAMELVTGGDAERLRQVTKGRLSPRRSIEIVRDAATGLAAIHRVGLVHRDIKPANIFLTDDGSAKLADLGLSRQASGEDRMTMTGIVLGTPAYMSPEQAEGRDGIDIRSDIYALGVTLYALVTGEPPYAGSSPLAIAAKTLYEPFPDPLILVPNLPSCVIQVIRTCTQKKPSKRFQTPADLMVALDRVLGDRHLGPDDLAHFPAQNRTSSGQTTGYEVTVTADRQAVTTAETRVAAATAATRSHRSSRSWLGRRALLLTLSGGLGLGAAGLAWWWHGQQQAQDREAQSLITRIEHYPTGNPAQLDAELAPVVMAYQQTASRSHWNDVQASWLAGRALSYQAFIRTWTADLAALPPLADAEAFADLQHRLTQVEAHGFDGAKLTSLLLLARQHQDQLVKEAAQAKKAQADADAERNKRFESPIHSSSRVGAH